MAEMAGAQRAERISIARRLLAAGRLCQLRMSAVDAADREQWCIDNWEAVAAEVGAELGISRARASVQMNYGLELLERLPKLGEAFAHGEVDFRVIAVAVFRTGLITDPAILAAIDARLAVKTPQWNTLARARIAEAVDWWVRDLDPAAERVARRSTADRHIEIGSGQDGLAEFWGDLCCRFPGCDKPAEVCDIDHTIPYRLGGPTHPSNLSLKCRAHHLLKTFWSGQNGWREGQFSDGTIVWTSPAGRRYTTTPGGAMFFPQLAMPTQELSVVVPLPDDPRRDRTMLMPTRKRTRAAERATRIAWERGVNEARWAADPPPF